MRSYDGYTPMAAIDGAQVTGRYAAYSKSATSEGVVVARYACDDEGNRSKKFTEYDVKELRTGQVFRGVRRLSESGGVDSGDDIPLRPAQKSAEQGTLNNGTFDPLESPLLSSDGDHVVLAFLQGSQDSAVITGVVPHTRSAYANTKADGDRKFSIHRGTSMETKDDGTFIVRRHLTPVAPGQPYKDDGNVTTLTIQANGDIELVHASGATLRVLEDGSVRADGPGKLVLGSPPTEVGVQDGLVHARGIDSWTGVAYGLLGNASDKVIGEK
jgi:hypothetical protein